MEIKFNNKAQKKAYFKVLRYLEEICGRDNVEKLGPTTFTFIKGSAIVYIDILAWNKNSSIVRFACHLVYGAKVTSKLKEFLLKKNMEFNFGSFGLTQDNVITFQYSILGDFMDKEEFVTALVSVANISDEYDNKIIDEYGGITSLDKLKGAPSMADKYK